MDNHCRSCLEAYIVKVVVSGGILSAVDECNQSYKKCSLFSGNVKPILLAKFCGPLLLEL